MASPVDNSAQATTTRTALDRVFPTGALIVAPLHRRLTDSGGLHNLPHHNEPSTFATADGGAGRIDLGSVVTLKAGAAVHGLEGTPRFHTSPLLAVVREDRVPEAMGPIGSSVRTRHGAVREWNREWIGTAY